MANSTSRINGPSGEYRVAQADMHEPSYIPNPLAGSTLPDPPLDYKSPNLRHIQHVDDDVAWQKCYQLVQKYDNDICQTYREQLDTLLVFAGLFSAVVTAFTIESYQWLQGDPNVTSDDLLRQAVGLLAEMQNKSVPVYSPQSSSGLSLPTATRINAYWFLSLTLSLSAALLGILCKQWVREYERDAGQSHRVALGVRHVKHQGLEAWGVGGIVSSVPLILQLALALFLTGLLELLWRLQSTIAALVSAAAGLTGLIYVATAFLPLIQCLYMSRRVLRFASYRPKPLVTARARMFTTAQCPYKSPQAWLVIRIFRPIVRLLSDDFFTGYYTNTTSWISFDVSWTEAAHCRRTVEPPFQSLAWLSRTVGDTQLPTWIWSCAWGDLFGEKPGRGTPGHASYSIAHLSGRPEIPIYPRIVLRNQDQLNAICQAHLFFFAAQHMHLNAALEIFLRVVPVIGLQSQFAEEALKALSGMGTSDIDHELSQSLLDLFQKSEWGANLRFGHPLVLLPHAIRILTSTKSGHASLVPGLCAAALDALRQVSAASLPEPIKTTELILDALLNYYLQQSDEEDQLALVGRLVAHVDNTCGIPKDRMRWQIRRLLQLGHSSLQECIPAHDSEVAASRGAGTPDDAAVGESASSAPRASTRGPRDSSPNRHVE